MCIAVVNSDQSGHSTLYQVSKSLRHLLISHHLMLFFCWNLDLICFFVLSDVTTTRINSASTRKIAENPDTNEATYLISWDLDDSAQFNVSCYVVSLVNSITNEVEQSKRVKEPEAVCVVPFGEYHVNIDVVDMCGDVHNNSRTTTFTASRSGKKMNCVGVTAVNKLGHGNKMSSSSDNFLSH